MSTFEIDLKWKRNADFTYEKYNRDHTLHLGGNQIVENSASVEYFGNPNMANPEELLAASLSSCHMMTLLAIASKSGYIIDSYSDHATAKLEKNAEGYMAVSEITLSPKIEFSGDKKPTTEQLKSMHDKAHRNCFIANSITSKVHVH